MRYNENYWGRGRGFGRGRGYLSGARSGQMSGDQYGWKRGGRGRNRTSECRHPELRKRR